MNSQKGQILIIALVFMTIMLVLTGSLVAYVGQNVGGNRRALAREQALQLAEAGIDKAIYMLNQTAGGYIGETNTALGAGEFDVVLINLSPTLKEIRGIGYVPNKIYPKGSREVRVRVTIDTESVSFNYGVQVGEGGLVMGNNAKITGNVYSNGPVRGSNGAIITGDVISAGPAGRIYDHLQVDGTARAHTINYLVQAGKDVYGYNIDDISVGENAYAYSMSDCSIGGDAHYGTISSCSVGGGSFSGYPGAADPAPEPFVLSAEQIDGWKSRSASGGTIVGNYTIDGIQMSMGPKKIDGDLTVINNAILTLTGPLWVTGNINISNNAHIRLDPAYGDTSEVLVADGVVDISNNAVFDRAAPGSYITIITTSSSADAFDVANNSDTLVVYAPNGSVDISNNAILREVSGWQIRLANEAQVIYEIGLASLEFTSGPGASWQIVDGSWREAR